MTGKLHESTHEPLLASAAIVPAGLTQRHFVLQDQRPPHLDDVDLNEVEPFLRGLLFTDGTVTRALEVQALSRVAVEVIDQTDTKATGQAAHHLDVPSGTASVRRRVVIGAGGSTARPAIWAESHILPARLPAKFLAVLQGAPDGIGESLQQVKLESWRDLLWLGLDSHPEWSCVSVTSSSSVITRLYRVITGGRPALLISESFAVTRRDGKYRLACLE